MPVPEKACTFMVKIWSTPVSKERAKNALKEVKMRTIEEMRKLFADKGYILISEEYHSNKEPLIFEKDGYKYQNSYNGFIKTSNPKKWGKNNPFSLENLALYLKRIGATCIPIQYENYSATLICSCGEQYTVAVNNLLKTKQFQCPKCGRKNSALNHIKDKYREEIEKAGYTLVGEYKGAKHYSYWEDKLGYYYKFYPYAFSHSQKDFSRIVFNVSNKYCAENYRNFIKLNGLNCSFVEESLKKSHDQLELICACGKHYFVQAGNFRLLKIDCCPDCLDKYASSFEKKIGDFFKENNIDFILQKTFPGLVYKKSLKCDFYLPDYNAVIEADGPQHEKAIDFFCNEGLTPEQSFEELKIRDEIKNNYCFKHDIRLLRIPYKQFLNNEYKESIKAFLG